jgi:hypothetical protein
VAAERRSRAWWQKTVSEWRRSGLTAGEYAAREALTVRTLRWWSSMLSRGTRAKHAYPIELALPAETRRSTMIEVVVGAVTVRFESGADVAVVASLVRALGEPRS